MGCHEGWNGKWDLGGLLLATSEARAPGSVLQHTSCVTSAWLPLQSGKWVREAEQLLEDQTVLAKQ